MTKLIFIFLLMSMTLFNVSELATLTCSYEYYNFQPLGSIYYCWTQNYVNIYKREQAFIDSSSGGHMDGHTNEAINGLWLRWGVMHYFPRNLSRIYPNIKAVAIIMSELEEIKQSDIKTIPKLEHLQLPANKIKILEDRLFDYNPELKFIDFTYNQIYSIGTGIFNNLKGLYYLDLEGNTCIQLNTDRMYVYDKETPDLQLAKETALTNCSGSAFFELQDKFDNLNLELENFITENFKIRIDELENELATSKYNKSKTLHEKLYNLKVIADPSIKINQTEFEFRIENNQTDSNITAVNRVDKKKIISSNDAKAENVDNENTWTEKDKEELKKAIDDLGNALVSLFKDME